MMIYHFENVSRKGMEFAYDNNFAAHTFYAIHGLYSRYKGTTATLKLRLIESNFRIMITFVV